MSEKKSFFEKLLGGKKSGGCCNMEIVDNDCCGEVEVQANDTDCKCDCCPSEKSDN